MRNEFGWVGMMLFIAALFALPGCGDATPEASAEQEAAEHDDHAHDEHGHEHAELAEPMGQMQYFSQKLGYAIEAENTELADFYLHELEELAGTIREEITEYEGFQIAELTGAMLVPMLEAQEEALDSGDWSATQQSYEQLIQSCNACHAGTEHGFIQITPAEGEPPFNQRFAPAAE